MLYLVATPIGNLEDVTFRAVRVLGDVAIIAAEDTRRAAKLLRHYRIQTPTLSFHSHNEMQRTPKLISMLEQGKSVALVTDAGTPLLSDPGRGLVKDALACGIKVQPIPGASAILSGLIASGLTADQFTFAGFPPNRSQARKLWLKSLAGEKRPVVLFEAPHRIVGSLRDMLEVLGDREVAICRELTKIHEELVNGPISSILSRPLTTKGEFTVVVTPELITRKTPTEQEIVAEFGRLANTCRSRREAVALVAKNNGLSAQIIYGMLEDSKGSFGRTT